MAFFYHTRTLIFSIANGYCSDVLDRGHAKMATNLVGCRLLGGVAASLEGGLIPIDEIVAGQRLKLEVGTAAFISEVIELVEVVGTLSIPPTRLPSLPPETDPLYREPVATIPEIILPKPPGVPKP